MSLCVTFPIWAEACLGFSEISAVIRRSLRLGGLRYAILGLFLCRKEVVVLFPSKSQLAWTISVSVLLLGW